MESCLDIDSWKTPKLMISKKKYNMSYLQKKKDKKDSRCLEWFPEAFHIKTRKQKWEMMRLWSHELWIQLFKQRKAWVRLKWESSQDVLGKTGTNILLFSVPIKFPKFWNYSIIKDSDILGLRCANTEKNMWWEMPDQLAK